MFIIIKKKKTYFPREQVRIFLFTKKETIKLINTCMCDMRNALKSYLKFYEW